MGVLRYTCAPFFDASALLVGVHTANQGYLLYQVTLRPQSIKTLTLRHYVRGLGTVAILVCEKSLLPTWTLNCYQRNEPMFYSALDANGIVKEMEDLVRVSGDLVRISKDEDEARGNSVSTIMFCIFTSALLLMRLMCIQHREVMENGRRGGA